jgi:hypothetical protein
MRLIGLVAVYQRPNTSKPAAAHHTAPATEILDLLFR